MCDCHKKDIPSEFYKFAETLKALNAQTRYVSHGDTILQKFIRSTDYQRCLLSVGDDYITVIAKINTLKFSDQGIIAYTFPFRQSTGNNSKHILVLYDTIKNNYYSVVIARIDGRSKVLIANDKHEYILKRLNTLDPVSIAWGACIICVLEAGAAPVTGGTSLMGLILCVLCYQSAI